MVRKKYSIKNQNITTIINVLSTVILQGLAFFSSPYFSRVLESENFGVVSVYVAWVQVVSIVFGLRINGVLIMGQNEYSKEEQQGFQSSVMFLAIISFICFSGIAFVINYLILHESVVMLLMILLHGFGQFSVSYANSKFTNEFRADLNFYLSLFCSISTIILSVFLISCFHNEVNYWGRILGEALPYFFVGLIIAAIVLIKGKILFSSKYWMFCIPLVIPMVFHGLAGIILNQSDRVMLDMMSSSSLVGIYSLAYTFSNVVFICWSALNNSWVPFYYEHMRNGELDIIKRKSKNYMELFSILCCGFILLSTEVYHLFAGKEYWDGTMLIPIFAISSFMIFLYSFPVNYEIFYKKTRSIANASIICATVNIGLNFILIHFFDIYGAAFATLLSYILQMMIHHSKSIGISKTNNDYTFKIVECIPYLVLVVGVAIMTLLNVNILIRWSLALFLGIFEIMRMYRRRGIF